MFTDPTRIVQALVNAELIPHHERGHKVEPVVVTLSRSYGSGGEEVARRLAERLGVTYYDHELLIRVSEDANVDSFLMERLDEHVKGTMNDWVYNILTGQSAYREDYKKHLVNVVLGIMNSGGVLVGRGANIILRKHHAFRVRIVGSEDACASRVATERGVSIDQARERIREVNQERAEFIRMVYGRELEDETLFDVVINTDHLRYSDAVELILCAMRYSGFNVPEETPYS